MNAKSLRQSLLERSANHQNLAAKIVRTPALLERVFNGLSDEKARVKYGSLKLLRILSETKPGLIYPEIERLFQLLETENRIFKWGAILSIANLARVDSVRKIEAHLEQCLRLIRAGDMVTAANGIVAAGRIAEVKPHLADRIAQNIFLIEDSTYKTKECRNVLLGHAVDAFDLFFEHLQRPAPVIAFVARQRDNPRNAVRKRAETFLKKRKLESLTAKAKELFPPSNQITPGERARAIQSFQAIYGLATRV